MHRSALQYAARGWPVFPVKEDKKPYTEHGFKDASLKIDAIRAFWRTWPKAGIGIATGNGLLVVDVDVGKGGVLPAGLPETLTARTQSGGTHHYYSVSEPLAGNVGVLAQGVDVRCEGGYVVAPPSFGKYSWVNALSIAPLPQEFVEKLRKPLGKPALPPVPVSKVDESTLAAALQLLEECGQAVEGDGGDNKSFIAACLLVRDMALPEDVARVLFYEWNLKNQPPWGERDCERFLRSARENGKGGPLIEEVDEVLEPEPMVIGGEFEEYATDLGNAELLVKHFGKDIRYVSGWGKWISWGGHVWRLDDSAALRMVHALAGVVKRKADSMQSKANALTAEKTAMANRLMATNGTTSREDLAEQAVLDAKEARMVSAAATLFKRAMALQNINTSRNLLAQLAAKHQVESGAMDAQPMLLNVGNGVVDLHTGTLLPASRANFLTKNLETNYIPDAKCPLWEGFLSQAMLGDMEMVAYLQRAVGYSITGDVGEHAFFFCHGDGRNGKSTFIGTIQALLGPYATTAVADLLLKRHRQHDSDTSGLPGVRFLVHGEPGRGRSFDDGIIKQLTGGDRVSARFMRHERFEFMPSHKIWISSNPMPRVDGQDLGIWRRVRLIPFEHTVSEAGIDKDLPQKLRGELPGILAWAVRGCLAWQSRGLDEPNRVISALQDYRNSEDLVQEFLSDSYRKYPGGFVSRKEMYLLYQLWCSDSGYRPLTSKDFVSEVRRTSAAVEHRTEEARGWLGLAKHGDGSPKTIAIKGEKRSENS